MLRSFLYFLSINILYFGLVAVISNYGFEYDKAHRLYPENLWWGSDVSIIGHGQRRVRFFKYAAWFAGIVDIAIVYAWYRRNAKKEDLSITLN